MVDQLRAIDNRRFIKRLGMIGRSKPKELAENIRIILGEVFSQTFFFQNRAKARTTE